MTEDQFVNEMTKAYILELEKRWKFWRLLGLLLSALTLLDLFAYHW